MQYGHQTGLSPLLRLGIALLIASLSVGCRTPVGTGHGRVIDAVSKTPVPGATVKVSCGTPRPWHGHDWAEYTAISRAPDGAFHIDVERADLQRCNYISTNAFKDGYVPNNSRLSDVGREGGLPEIVYVINNRDLPALELNALFREIPVFPRAAGEAPRYFGKLYQSFAQSRAIAVDSAMEAWVRKNHCPRLREAYALLSESERSSLDMPMSDGIRVTPSTYNDSVVTFCSASDPGPP